MPADDCRTLSLRSPTSQKMVGEPVGPGFAIRAARGPKEIELGSAAATGADCISNPVLRGKLRARRATCHSGRTPHGHLHKLLVPWGAGSPLRSAVLEQLVHSVEGADEGGCDVLLAVPLLPHLDGEGAQLACEVPLHKLRDLAACAPTERIEFGPESSTPKRAWSRPKTLVPLPAGTSHKRRIGRRRPSSE